MPLGLATSSSHSASLSFSESHRLKRRPDVALYAGVPVRYVHEDVNVHSERSTDESTLGNRSGLKNTGSGCDTPGPWCSTAERWTGRQPDYQTLF